MNGPRNTVCAGVLIGGNSRRMGSPKHLLEIGGRSLLARAVDVLQRQCDPVVVCGSGSVPWSLRGLHVLSDVPDVHGPLAGMLAALRWRPESTWILAACDMPKLSAEAVSWLIAQRQPGRWAIMPRRENLRQPLLALYEPQSAVLFEDLVRQGVEKPRQVANHPKVWSPVLPPGIAEAWINVNTRSEFARYAGS